MKTSSIKKEEVKTLILPEEQLFEKRSFKEALDNPNRFIGLIAEVKKRRRQKDSLKKILFRSRLQKTMKLRRQTRFLF